MRAEALKLFRKLFLNKYARVINYFGLLCHNDVRVRVHVHVHYVSVLQKFFRA